MLPEIDPWSPRRLDSRVGSRVRFRAPCPSSLLSGPSMSPAPDVIGAFRQLCELLYRATPARLEAGLSVDWSSHPRIDAALRAGGLDATPELVAQRMRQVLEEAYLELSPRFPSSEAQLSSLEVLRLHLIDGLSWEAITAERMEKGVPVSARTLRSRQKDALEAVLAWAATDPTPRSTSDTEPRSPDATLPVTRPRKVRNDSLVALALLTLVLLGWMWLAAGRPEDVRVHPTHVGARVLIEAGATKLPPPFPPYQLPQLETPIRTVVIVPLEDRRPGLVVLTTPVGGHRGRVGLYDVGRERMRWTKVYDPPPDEVMTHAGLDAEALTAPFRPAYLYYGRHDLNLGASVAVVYVQDYSPCFVLVRSLENGEELGRYVHPGRLETGDVLDLDLDGRPELLLGGSDNTFTPARMVAAILDPTALSGAASTVQWRESPGESACTRVMLPAIPDLLDALGAPRFRVLDFLGKEWDPDQGVLTLRVGDARGPLLDHVTVYQVRLGGDLRPRAPKSIFLGENELLLWKRAGVPIELTTELEQDILVEAGPLAGPVSKN